MGFATQSTGRTRTDWMPTFTGFSATPTITAARYTINGKWVDLHLRMDPTTSNATTFMLTLPFAAANTAVQTFVVAVVNNGAFQASAGKLNTRVNSNIADVFLTITSGAFTASGTKAVTCSITYEIA